MSFKERVENNVVVWLLGTLFAGFLAGIGTYQTLLEIAKLAVISKDRLSTLEQSADRNGSFPPASELERRALYIILADRLEAELRTTAGKRRMVEEGASAEDVDFKRMQRAIFFNISALQADPVILGYTLDELEKRGHRFVRTIRPRVLAEFPALRQARLRWLEDKAVPALEAEIRSMGAAQQQPFARVPLPKILLIKQSPAGSEPTASVSNLGALEDEIRLIKGTLNAERAS
jgi:hypothetical protein